MVLCISFLLKKKLPHAFIVIAQKKNPASVFYQSSPSNNFLFKEKKNLLASQIHNLKIHRTIFIPKKILKKISPPPIFFWRKKSIELGIKLVWPKGNVSNTYRPSPLEGDYCKQNLLLWSSLQYQLTPK